MANLTKNQKANAGNVFPWETNELIAPEGKSTSRKARRAKERASRKRSKPAKALPDSFKPQSAN